MTDDSATHGRWALVLLVALAGASLFWLVDPWFRPTYDADHYLLTARSLLAGDGYAVYGEPFSLRPPGFTFLLVPLLALFGTDFLVLNLFVALSGLLALALIFAYFRPRLGTLLTFALCASLWINPQFRRLSSEVLSDMLGVAGVMGCLLLERWARRRPGTGREVVLGLALGAVSYLRTVCILLVPAILASRWLRRRDRRTPEAAPRGRVRWVLVLVLPLLAQVPWSLWKRAHPPQLPLTQFGIYSYWTGQFLRNAADPESPPLTTAEVLDRVPIRGEQFLRSFGSRLRLKSEEIHSALMTDVDLGASGPLVYWAGWGIVLCLVGVGAWRRDPGNLMAIGTLVVLLTYFGFDVRLLMTSYVFGVVAVLEVLRSVLRRQVPARLLPLGLGLGLLALAAGDMSFEEAREAKRWHQRAVEVAEYVDEHYPPDVAVGACPGFTLAAFFDRPLYFLEIALSERSIPGGLDVIQRRDLKVLLHTPRDLSPELTRCSNLILRSRGTRVHEIGGIRVYELGPPR